MYSILKNTKISIQSLKAADNETLTGAGVDMLGFDSVCFIPVALKGEALSFSIKAQQAAVCSARPWLLRPPLAPTG
jgi:hypothetical protein